jgi:hypothetical protein
VESERSSEQRARAATTEHQRIQGDWHDWTDWGAVMSQRGGRSDVKGEVIDPRRRGVRVQGHKKGGKKKEQEKQGKGAKKGENRGQYSGVRW